MCAPLCAGTGLLVGLASAHEFWRLDASFLLNSLNTSHCGPIVPIPRNAHTAVPARWHIWICGRACAGGGSHFGDRYLGGLVASRRHSCVHGACGTRCRSAASEQAATALRTSCAHVPSRASTRPYAPFKGVGDQNETRAADRREAARRRLITNPIPICISRLRSARL